jgi:uncharacterized protein YdhG (YjbR/CyaY superfamily)
MTAFEDYIARGTPPEQAALERIRAIAKEMVPEAEEVISYMMPTFKINGKAFLGMAINKHSIGLYPYSGSVLTHMKSDVSQYKTALSAINFTTEEQFPEALLREMISLKLAEIAAK